MRIHVPLSDNKNHPLTMLVIYLPDGTQVKVKTGMPVYDYTLPAGVTEDEIDVYSIFLGQDQKPAYGCGPVCIKRATKVTAAEAAAEAAAPAIDATEPPSATPLTHVEHEAAALHTVTNHANDKHDAGTATVSEPAATASAPAADVPAPAAYAPSAAAAATSIADAAAASDPAAVVPAAPAVEPAAPVAGPVSEPAAHTPAAPAPAAPVDVKPAKHVAPVVKHTSNANIGKFETAYDPKHGRKS